MRKYHCKLSKARENITDLYEILLNNHKSFVDEYFVFILSIILSCKCIALVSIFDKLRTRGIGLMLFAAKSNSAMNANK